MKLAACLILCSLCVSYTSAENSWKVVVTEAEFDEHVENADKQLVVLEFSAKWCGPCNVIAPVLAKLAPKYPNVVLLKADIDELAELATRFSVTALPTFFFLKSGDKVDRVIGANVPKVEETITRLLENSK